MKILIVDDEFSALTKMKTLLSAYGDCIPVTNGFQALEQCTTAIKNGDYFDLITIDIGLPKVSGLEVLEAVNRLEKARNAPVAKKIIVTASGTKSNLVQAAQRGCDGFMVKPVKRDSLDEKMTLLGFAKQESSTGPDMESGPT